MDQLLFCPVGWGCRIHRLLLCRGIRPQNECPRYDTKQSDGEAPVILELWGMWSTHSLLSLLGSFWPGMVAPDNVPSMGQIELNSILMLNWIAWIELFWHMKCVLRLNWIVWNRTVFTFKLHIFAELNC